MFVVWVDRLIKAMLIVGLIAGLVWIGYHSLGALLLVLAGSSALSGIGWAQQQQQEKRRQRIVTEVTYAAEHGRRSHWWGVANAMTDRCRYPGCGAKRIWKNGRLIGVEEIGKMTFKGSKQ